MGPPTLIRRELAAAQLCFIPVGEVVDAVTVAAETWPDNIPTTNYTDYEIPDIEKVVLEKDVETEDFMVPGEIGGYEKDDEQMVTSRKWVATTAKTSSLIKQLDMGLDAVVVASTAQVHGKKHDNYILGVLQIVEKSKTGDVLQTTKVWAKMRVRTAGDTAPSTKKIEVEFKQQYSSLNTVTVL